MNASSFSELLWARVCIWWVEVSNGHKWDRQDDKKEGTEWGEEWFGLSVIGVEASTPLSIVEVEMEIY